VINYKSTIDEFVQEGVINRALLEMGGYQYIKTMNGEEAYLKGNTYYWFEQLTPKEESEKNYCLRLTGTTPMKKE